MSKQSKQQYKVSPIRKKEAKVLIDQYHYLSSQSKGFMGTHNYGLIRNGVIVGACVFSIFSGNRTAMGLFGIQECSPEGMFELIRLAIDPDVQQEEHNIASWFLSRSIKHLRKDTTVKCVLSYADSHWHSGITYKACNFKYYGLTDKKSDFWVKDVNGNYKIQQRGKTKDVEGEWRDRSRKHRYLLLFDDTLNVLWEEQKYPKSISKRFEVEKQESLEDIF